MILGVAAVVGLLLLIVEFGANYKYQNNSDSGSDIALYQGLQDETLAGNAKSQTDEPDVNAADNSYETVVLAGGCFWCVEADMEKAPGVIAVVSGYSGGSSENPLYSNYAQGGHREVVEVIYDPSQTSYESLVEYLIKHIDPTDPNGSFVDRGVQYSPAIYYQTEAQKQTAIDVIAKIEELNVYDAPIAVPVLPEAKFYPAEDYHQDFYKKSVVRYQAYRLGSGRDAFVKKYWDN